MGDTLNSVTAEQGSVVENQMEEATIPDSTVPGEGENAVVAAQQTDEEGRKPAQTREENAKIKEIRLKYEQEKADAERKARDVAAAEIAKRFNLNADGREINSFEDFEKFGLELEMKNASIDPDAYAKLRDSDPEVKRAKEILAQQDKSRKEMESFRSFCDAFRDANGRAFDPKADFSIYAEIQSEAEKSGKDILDAYAIHQNKSLSARLAELETKLREQETNRANANSMPGSVTTNGEPTDGADYISADAFEQHRSDSTWVRKNYDKIMKSRPKWGG